VPAGRFDCETVRAFDAVINTVTGLASAAVTVTTGNVPVVTVPETWTDQGPPCVTGTVPVMVAGIVPLIATVSGLANVAVAVTVPLTCVDRLPDWVTPTTPETSTESGPPCEDVTLPVTPRGTPFSVLTVRSLSNSGMLHTTFPFR
jgi:hypothetical protein